MTVITRDAGSGATINAPPGHYAPPEYGLLTVFLFGTGTLLQIFAYASVEPLLAGLLLFGIGAVPLWLTGWGGHEGRLAFRLVLSVGWTCAGIAAMYYVLGDAGQHARDATHFFRLSARQTGGTTLEDLAVVTEGAGAVVLWRAVYDALAGLGFAKEPYIGVAVNVLLVALSAVFGVRVVAHAFGGDSVRVRRFTILTSLCGLFWLFAAIHMRDAAVLLGVSALALSWIRYIAQPGTRRVVEVGFATAIGLAFFGFLRTEFMFVPVAMLFSAAAARVLESSARGRRPLLIFLFAAVVVPAVIYLVSLAQSDLLTAVMRANEMYANVAGAQSSDNSLGMRLIVNAPLPMRLVLGSAYMFIFPIPIWNELDSAYGLFKTCQAIFMYGFTPLYILAVWRLIRCASLRSATSLFLLFLTLGFTLAIAATSLETRHFGAFLIPMLALGVLPDLRLPADRAAYVRLLALLLCTMTIVHAAWAVLKAG